MLNKKLSIGFFLLFLVLMLSSLTIYYFKSRQVTYADEIITKTTDRFNKSLVTFLDAANDSRKQLSFKGLEMSISGMTDEELNAYFTNMIDQDAFLKGVIIIGHHFHYVLVHEGSTWTTTYSTTEFDTLVNWKRLDEKNKMISAWSDTYSYVLSRDSYSYILNEIDSVPNDNIWINVRSSLPDKRDMLMTVFNMKDINQSSFGVAFLYSTREMQKKFISVLKYDTPLVSVFAQNGDVITPLRTTDTTKIRQYSLLNQQVINLLPDWMARADRQNYNYSFVMDDQVYWSRMMHVNEVMGIVGYAVTISAEDLAKTENEQELIYVYLAALFFILGALSFVTMKRHPSNTASALPDPIEALKLTEITNLIKQGESESVEFKSSLRYDYKEKVVNKFLEDVILKSISAFANAKGGILFIGVSDDQGILGLEPDFHTLKKQDVDYFELHLRKLITNQFGLTYSNHFLNLQFVSLESKTIAVIQILPANRPLFISTKTRQGAETEKFYVRSGNASQEVSSLKEMNDYINRRFGKHQGVV